MKRKILIGLFVLGLVFFVAGVSYAWVGPGNTIRIESDGDPWQHDKSYHPDDSTAQNNDVYLLSIAPYIVIIKIDLGQNLSKMIKNPDKAKSDHPINSYSEKRRCIRTQRIIRR